MVSGINSDPFAEWGRLAMTRDYIADSTPGDIPAEPPDLAPTAGRLQMLFDFVDSYQGAWNQYAKERIMLNAVDDLKPKFDDAACVKARNDEYTAVLRAVPEIFFRENWQPESIIDKIYSNSHFSPEQLQANLDQVEMCLLNHIQNQSESFFSTMHTLHELYVETDKMLKVVHSARKKVRLLMKKTVLPHFNLVYFRRKQKRLLHSRRKLSIITDVKRSFDFIQSSIDSSGFESALSVIIQTRDVMKKGGRLNSGVCGIVYPKTYFLEQFDFVACSNVLNDHLHTLERRLSKTLSSECAQIIYDTLDKQFNADYTKCILTTWLRLQDSTENLIDQISNAMQNASKTITSDVISKAVADVDQDNGLVLSSPSDSCPEPSFINAISSLSELQFTDLLLHLYAALDTLFGKVSSLCNVLHYLDQTDDVVTLRRQLENVLRNATESSHARCARIIGIRKKAESDIFLSTVCLRLQAGLEFVRKDEERCGTSFLAIRQLLVQQARLCLSEHHAMFMKQIIHALDYDKWQAANAEKRFQKMIDRRFSILMHDIALSRQDSESEPWSLPDWNENVCSSSSSGDDRPSSPSIKLSYLVVNDERFRVTLSLLELLSNIQETFMIAHMLPKEICPWDLVCVQLCTMLRNYNSRSYQLILGAAATSLPDSKVKQISTKMLCLLSQNIGLLLTLIPLLKAAVSDQIEFKTRLTTQLMQFEQIRKDLSDHRQSIFMKIISIMDDVISSTCEQLLKIGATNFDDAERCLVDLMKQTRLLYRFVSSTLPPRQVNQIFTEISKHIGSAIASCLEKVVLPRKRMYRTLSDIRLQLVNMGIRIDHVSAFSDLDDFAFHGDYDDSVSISKKAFLNKNSR